MLKLTVSKYYKPLLLGSTKQQILPGVCWINQIFCRHLEIVFANPQPARSVVIVTIIQVNAATFHLLKHVYFTAEESGTEVLLKPFLEVCCSEKQMSDHSH